LTATKEEIKESWRKLAIQYHPDKNPGHAAMFNQVTDAYQVLSGEMEAKPAAAEIPVIELFVDSYMRDLQKDGKAVFNTLDRMMTMHISLDIERDFYITLPIQTGSPIVDVNDVVTNLTRSKSQHVKIDLNSADALHANQNPIVSQMGVNVLQGLQNNGVLPRAITYKIRCTPRTLIDSVSKDGLVALAPLTTAVICQQHQSLTPTQATELGELRKNYETAHTKYDEYSKACYKKPTTDAEKIKKSAKEEMDKCLKNFNDKLADIQKNVKKVSDKKPAEIPLTMQVVSESLRNASPRDLKLDNNATTIINNAGNRARQLNQNYNRALGLINTLFFTSDLKRVVSNATKDEKNAIEEFKKQFTEQVANRQLATPGALLSSVSKLMGQLRSPDVLHALQPLVQLLQHPVTPGAEPPHLKMAALRSDPAAPVEAPKNNDASLRTLAMRRGRPSD
jgi:hypothetical protein